MLAKTQFYGKFGMRVIANLLLQLTGKMSLNSRSETKRRWTELDYLIFIIEFEVQYSEQYTRSALSFRSAYMELHRPRWQKCALRLLPALVAIISVQQHMAICYRLERGDNLWTTQFCSLCLDPVSGMICHRSSVYHPAHSDSFKPH